MSRGVRRWGDLTTQRQERVVAKTEPFIIILPACVYVTVNL